MLYSGVNKAESNILACERRQLNRPVADWHQIGAAGMLSRLFKNK